LRPSGTANINGQRVDVVTEGGLIERGTAVKVVAVEGSRIVVRAV
jgi:membrane-bound serine protease (ClpP class)